jgi:hypothetical protein
VVGESGNPFKSTEHKQRDAMDMKERPPKPGPDQAMFPKPFIEMKIHDNVLYDYRKQQPPQNNLYPYPYVPVPNPYGPGNQVPWTFTPYAPPIVKRYNVNISNVDGNMTRIGEIYEDILPKSSIAQNRYTTLSERMVISNYYRSILVQRGDGEEIVVGSNAGRERFEIHNLLSHIRVMDINPYHFNRLTNNPYRTLPDNMVMFRSCYPIRYNQDRSRVECAKDSMPTHIRIYAQTVFDMLAGKLTNIRKADSDLWREIIYYEYIREEVLKRKVCPNFVGMYAYYTTVNSAVNFVKLKELKRAIDSQRGEEVEKNNARLRSEVFERTFDKQLKDSLQYWPFKIVEKKFYPMLDPNDAQIQVVVDKTKPLVKMEDGVLVMDNRLVTNSLATVDEFTKQLLMGLNPKPEAFADRCVVAITEGNSCNIIDWSTKTYEVNNGPIRRQVETGVNDLRTWKSVLFQLMAAMYTMDLKKIAFQQFSLARNVYVKDLQADLNNVGYWRYRVKGVDFYVPNYGYLVMVDSCYEDLRVNASNRTVPINLSNDETHCVEHKMYGSIFEDTYIKKEECGNPMSTTKLLNSDEYTWDKVAVENFKRAFKFDNSFGQEFKNFGGILPPDEIKTMFDTIVKMSYTPDKSKDKTKKDLGDIIIEMFKDEFTHNRVGQPLTSQEVQNLMPNRTDFVKGELVAYEVGPNFYLLSVYLDQVPDKRNQHKILTAYVNKLKNNGQRETVNEQVVTSDQLVRIGGAIDQNYRPNEKLSEDELLETYVVE